MLLYQGVSAFELWNDMKVSKENIRKVYENMQKKLGQKAGQPETAGYTKRLKQKIQNKKVKKNVGQYYIDRIYGCGKTTFGTWIAKNKKMDFCDTDALIVEKEKKSINDIFSENGEPYFRELETEIVKDLIKSRHNTVVSVGGGLPLKPENRELLKKLGTVVYLRTSVEELTKRLAGDTTRPLLAGGNIREKITHLMDMRLSDYLDAAEVIIDTDGRSFDEMYENILKEKREA